MSKNIVFIGAPTCGKSTATMLLCSELKKLNYNVEMVTEWARQDIWYHNAPKSLEDEYRIYLNQERIEASVPKNIDYLVVDSGTLTPYFYANLFADLSDPRHRSIFLDFYRYLIDDLYDKKYDHIFYLPMIEKDKTKDLDDGVRFQNAQDCINLDKHMRFIFFELHKLPNIHLIDCKLENRINTVMKIINR